MAKKNSIDLEKIASEGLSVVVNEMADKEKDLSKKIPLWVHEYIGTNYGTDQANSTYEILRRDPLGVTPLIQETLVEHEDNLIKEVRKNPKELVKKINPAYTTGLASKFFGDLNYRNLKEAIENNGDLKSIFAERYENNIWKNTVAKATPEAIEGAAKADVRITTQREIVRNLYDNKGNFDIKKASTYLTSNIEKQETDAQNESYKEMGLAYVQTKASKQ